MVLGDTAESGGIAAMLLAAGGGIGWFLNWWSNRDKDKRKEQLEDAARDKARSDELYERMKTDRDEAVKRERLATAALDVERSQGVEVRIVSEKKSECIRYYEHLMDEHGVDYPKWSERDPSRGFPPGPHGDPEPEHDR